MTDDVRMKARMAADLLDNPLLVECRDAAAHRLMKEWAATADDETTRREAIFHEMKALDAVFTELKTLVDDGLVAEHRSKHSTPK